MVLVVCNHVSEQSSLIVKLTLQVCVCGRLLLVLIFHVNILKPLFLSGERKHFHFFLHVFAFVLHYPSLLLRVADLAHVGASLEGVFFSDGVFVLAKVSNFLAQLANVKLLSLDLLLVFLLLVVHVLHIG